MKKQILALFMMISVFAAWSQDMSVKFSELEDQEYHIKILKTGILGDRLVTLVETTTGKYKLLMYTYDESSLLQGKTKEIMNDYPTLKTKFGKEYDFHTAYFMKEKLILLARNFTKSKGSHGLWGQVVNANGDYVGQRVELAKAEDESKKYVDQFKTAISEDGSKFMVLTDPDFETYDGTGTTLKIFNSELEEKVNLDLELPFKDKMISIADCKLANDGTVYLLVRVKLDRQERIKGGPWSYMTLVSVNTSDARMSKKTLKIEGKVIDKARLKINEKDKIIDCVALFYNVSEQNILGNPCELEGAYHFSMGMADNKTISETNKKFSQELIASILGKKINPKYKSIPASFNIENIVNMTDGSLIGIAENSYIRVSRDRDGAGNFHTVTEYIKECLLIIKIGKDGEIATMSIVPKLQSTWDNNWGNLSYMVMKKGDNVNILFCDSPGNLKLPMNTMKDIFTMLVEKNSNVVTVDIAKETGWKREKLWDAESREVTCYPLFGTQIAAGSWIMPALTPDNGTYGILASKKLSLGIVRIDY